MMSEMYTNYNKVIAVINGVFGAYFSSSEEEKYIASVNCASFTLNAPQLHADLERISNMDSNDIESFIPTYVQQFGAAYKQSFMTASGFGEATADRYATQAMGSMMEIIDTWLAMS